jgi:monomeric sarcosine oxidase
MRQSYSHVVIGAGALGSATAYRLALAGAERVLVLEQFGLGHGFGASEDHSRIIRHVYHSPDYALLTTPAYDAWDEVEEATGVTLVHKTGGIDLATRGTPGEEEFHNYRDSLTVSKIESEDLEASEIRKRWPQFRITDDVIGLYQQDGGVLDVRKANAAHIALARALGVEFLPHTTVTGVTSHNTHVTVETSREALTAENLVLCVASWLPTLAPQLGMNWQLTLSQEQVSYFIPTALRDFSPDRFPIWMWHDEHFFYGFPVYGEVAIKLARDMAGRFVTHETRSFEPDPAETELLAAFVRDRLPSGFGPELFSKTCVYDMPPDRGFILDHVPGHPRIVLGIGAGHAAKFASLLGRILADLATEGHTPYPIAPFRADRPALTDPAFVPTFRMAG